MTFIDNIENDWPISSQAIENFNISNSTVEENEDQFLETLLKHLSETFKSHGKYYSLFD